MRKLIVILVILLSLKGFSQNPVLNFPYLGNPTTNTYIRGWESVDSGFAYKNIFRDTLVNPFAVGEFRIRTQDNSLYVSISTTANLKWIRISGGGGSSGAYDHFSGINDSTVVFYNTTESVHDTIQFNFTAGGSGAGNPNSNIGSGYRWAVPNSNQVKTFFIAGYGGALDSVTNANAITLTFDTTKLATVSSVSAKLGSVIIGEYKARTVVDKGTYSASPTIAWTPKHDTVFLAWRDGLSHAEDGALMYTMSVDGGSTWKVPASGNPYDTVYINGSPAIGGTISIGYSANRLNITWTKGPAYTGVRFAYNNGRDKFFTGVDSVLTTGGTQAVSYGSMGVWPSGKIAFPGYSWNSGTDTAKSFLFESTDNGLTWTRGATIYASKISNTFPEGPISETNILRIEDTATSDATTKWIAIIRQDVFVAFHYHCYSTGGVTWTNTAVSLGVWAFGSQNNTGLPNSTGTTYGAPVSLLYENNIVYAFYGRRGTNNDFSLRMWSAPAVNVFSNPQFGNYTTQYRAIGAYKSVGEGLDWGYAQSFLTQTHEMKSVLYDPSISMRPGVDGAGSVSKRIRMVCIPVRGNNYFDAFANADQSISSGVETAVTTNYIWLDTDGAYNSDSSKIYVPDDGWYDIAAVVRFDTSSLGTYREAKLYAMDWGASYGVTPQYAPYLIDKKIIQPSTVVNFNFIRLSRRMYLYKGMQIKLTVKQDTGGTLNIKSGDGGTIYHTDENRAEIIFKKIN